VLRSDGECDGEWRVAVMRETSFRVDKRPPLLSAEEYLRVNGRMDTG
jgi:hypothetical protein